MGKIWQRWREARGQVPSDAESRSTDPLLSLVDGANRGEVEALRQLVSQVAPHLLRVARQALGAHHPEVHDVAQEAAWGFVRALPRFRGEASVVHFACRVALHTAMNVRRRDAADRRKLRSLQEHRAQLAGGEALRTPEGELSREQCLAAVRDLLAKLAEPQAEALGLHHVVGLTASEIAEVTRTPLETVRSRLKRGRVELKAAMIGEPRLAEQLEGRRGHLG